METNPPSTENPLLLFASEAPGVAASYNALIESIQALDGLDEKTRHLVYIGIVAALGNEIAVMYHVPMARAAGASWNEVRDAIMITLTVSGLSGVARCLPVAKKAWDSPSVG